MEENLELWTDEKHSSYLKNIEASFVDQLHESLDRYAISNQFQSADRWSRLEFRTWRDEVAAVFMQISNAAAEFTDQNFHDEVRDCSSTTQKKKKKKKKKKSSSKFDNQ